MKQERAEKPYLQLASSSTGWIVTIVVSESEVFEFNPTTFFQAARIYLLLRFKVLRKVK